MSVRFSNNAWVIVGHLDTFERLATTRDDNEQEINVCRETGRLFGGKGSDQEITESKSGLLIYIQNSRNVEGSFGSI